MERGDRCYAEFTLRVLQSLPPCRLVDGNVVEVIDEAGVHQPCLDADDLSQEVKVGEAVRGLVKPAEPAIRNDR